MTVSIVGGVLLAAGVLAVLVRPALLAWVLAAATAVPVTAAVTARGNSVPPFYLLAVLTVPFVLLPLDVRRRRRRAGEPDAALWEVPAPVRALLAFVLVALLVTALGPRLFAGQPILLPRGGIDAEVAVPTPLAYTASMAAQAGYLVLGVFVVVFVGQRVGTRTRVPEAAFVTGIGLSTAQWVWEHTGHAWPRGQFANYAHVTINVFEPRFHGIFPEPSLLAVFGLAAAAYYLVRLRTARGWALAGTLVMLAMSLFDLYLSASGTAALGVFVVGVVGYAAYCVSYLTGRHRITPAAVVVFLLPVALLAVAIPLADDLAANLAAKATSQSATNRFGSDRFSLGILRDTYGLGVGVGANRPSSFLTMLLSCTGLVGTLLLGYAVYRLLRTALRRPALLAAAWSLVALLVAKAIAEPSLSTPLLWLLAGVLLTASYERPPAAAAPAGAAPGRHRLAA